MENLLEKQNLLKWTQENIWNLNKLLFKNEPIVKNHPSNKTLAQMATLESLTNVQGTKYSKLLQRLQEEMLPKLLMKLGQLYYNAKQHEKQNSEATLRLGTGT